MKAMDFGFNGCGVPLVFPLLGLADDTRVPFYVRRILSGHSLLLNVSLLVFLLFLGPPSIFFFAL